MFTKQNFNAWGQSWQIPHAYIRVAFSLCPLGLCACAVAVEQKYNRGGPAWEAAKLPIIRAKHLRAKVKNWGGVSPPSPPGSAALVHVIQFVN